MPSNQSYSEKFPANVALPNAKADGHVMRADAPNLDRHARDRFDNLAPTS